MQKNVKLTGIRINGEEKVTLAGYRASPSWRQQKLIVIFSDEITAGSSPARESSAGSGRENTVYSSSNPVKTNYFSLRDMHGKYMERRFIPDLIFFSVKK